MNKHVEGAEGVKSKCNIIASLEHVHVVMMSRTMGFSCSVGGSC